MNGKDEVMTEDDPLAPLHRHNAKIAAALFVSILRRQKNYEKEMGDKISFENAANLERERWDYE